MFPWPYSQTLNWAEKGLTGVKTLAYLIFSSTAQKVSFYDIDTWTLSSLTGMATKMAGSTSPSAWLCSTSGARVVSATSSAASVVTWTSSVAIIVVSETEDSVVSTTGGNVITLYFSLSLTLLL